LKETILNIYLIIDNNIVTGFRAQDYCIEGDDESKIIFLKDQVRGDYSGSALFEAPVDKKGRKMSYRNFSKLEKQGRHFELFERIFLKYDIPENPLVCVTPVVDGELVC
jgi:hypothetical protein